MSKVKSLMGLSGIRHRPSMYAGSSDSEGMWTSLREPLDNEADIAFEGKNKSISLYRTGKHSFITVDQGPGIPVDPVDVENPISGKMEKVNGLTAVVSLTHTGSKFDANEEADGQRGTHGVGIKLTNAVSNSFEVWTCYRGVWYYTSYAKGKVVTAPKKVAAPKGPDGKTLKKGTMVAIEFDPSVFDKGSEVPEANILNWFEITSAFSTGVSFLYHDGKEAHTWESSGAQGFVDRLLEETAATPLNEHAVFHARGAFWDVAIAFTDLDGADLRGFTNGLPNVEGGAHVQSVYEAVSQVVSQYAKRGHKFKPSDLRDGLLGAINVRLTACKFHNQAKTKLVDERAGAGLKAELVEALDEFFARDKNTKALAATLCERATKLSALKTEFLQNKRAMQELKVARKKNALPNKLAASLHCTNEERELFLVEGDSAGGSAKRARDSHYQEVLPLKGKIPNAFGAKAKEVIECEEVLAMLIALGYDPSADDPLADIRVGKLILLTDADVDGLHIQNLILASLVRFTPQLINEGRVYVAQRYEYLATLKGKTWFAESLSELEKIAPKAAMANAMHLKGLGEVNPEVLADMAFNPELRKLTRLTPVDAKAIKRIAELAGTDASHRKELLGV
jgi:DNA gyrase subunit B